MGKLFGNEGIVHRGIDSTSLLFFRMYCSNKIDIILPKAISSTGALIMMGESTI